MSVAGEQNIDFTIMIITFTAMSYLLVTFHFYQPFFGNQERATLHLVGSVSFFGTSLKGNITQVNELVNFFFILDVS